MDEKTKKIIIVDDEEIILEILANIFEDTEYETVCFDTAKEALNIISESPDEYDLVISDIHMPEMDGYEFCKSVKALDISIDIPLIFSSSLTTLEDKIKGYNAGADDYVTKPVIAEDLKLKVGQLLKNKDDIKNLSQQINEAKSTAMQAMTYSSDLGRVVNFYEEAMLADSFENLAHRLFLLMHNYDLKCSLYIDDGMDKIIISDEGYASPLERKVFDTAKDQGRFFSFGKRTLVNYDNHSLLIKNMPIDDEDKYGLIKDILGAICNALSAKIALITNQINSERQKNTVFTILRTSIDEIDTSFRELQLKSMQIIEDMKEQIDEVIGNLGLMESTENKIENITDECLAKTNKNFYEGVKMKDVFEDLRTKIDECLVTQAPPVVESNAIESCSEPELF